MISMIEMYSRRIDERYIKNLMRASNLNQNAAEDRIRELFPVVREV